MRRRDRVGNLSLFTHVFVKVQQSWLWVDIKATKKTNKDVTSYQWTREIGMRGRGELRQQTSEHHVMAYDPDMIKPPICTSRWLWSHFLRLSVFVPESRGRESWCRRCGRLLSSIRTAPRLANCS